MDISKPTRARYAVVDNATGIVVNMFTVEDESEYPFRTLGTTMVKVNKKMKCGDDYNKSQLQTLRSTRRKEINAL